MTVRRGIGNVIGAIACAYLLVLQAAVGGLAMAGHHAGSSQDPFSVICLNSAGPDDAGDADGERKPLGCCTLGCAPAAMAQAHQPEPAPFAYDPRPTPLRAVAERDAPPRPAAVSRLTRPRGPPAIG